MKRVGRMMFDDDGRLLSSNWTVADTVFLKLGKAIERMALWLFRPLP